MKKNLILKMAILVGLSLVFLFQSGCSASLSFSSGELKGIVTDARSGANLSGVYVRTYSSDYYYDDYDYDSYNHNDWDYTNSNGSYSLHLSSGYYDVRFEKEGYEDYIARDIYVTSPFSRSLDISLTPFGNPNPSPTPSPSPSNVGTLLATKTGNASQLGVFDVFSNGQLQASSVSPVTTGQAPKGVKNIPNRSRIYVANSLDNTLSVFNSVTNFSAINGSPFALPSVSGAPYGIAYCQGPDKLRLFVSRQGSSPGIVNILDVSNSDDVQPIIDVNVADDPQEMAVNELGQILFVASRGGNSITAYDIANNVNPGAFTVTDPAGLAYYPDKKYLYVVSGSVSSPAIITLDVSNPASMTRVGADTTVTATAGKSVFALALDQEYNRLFTLDGDVNGYTIRTWNINGNPPYSEISNPVTIGTTSAKSLLYFQAGRLLFAAHDGTNADGIRVYDCSIYPAGQLLPISGSPFFGGSQYLKLDM